MYSPTLGRFMQTDPIGYGDGLNWYNYVGGDPINRRDPTGMLETVGPEIVVTGARSSGFGFDWWGSRGTVDVSFYDFSGSGGGGGGGGTAAVPQNGKANPFCAQVLQTLNNVDASANKVGGAAVDATLILAFSGIGDAGPAEVAAMVAGGAQATTVLASLGKGLATGDYRQFAVRALTAGGGSVLANSKIVKSLGTGADNPINKIGDFLNSLAPDPQCPRK